ncbi:MAG: hypothetical protein WAN60_00705 [Candidatus Sulfotelmatobacter sp.]
MSPTSYQTAPPRTSIIATAATTVKPEETWRLNNCNVYDAARNRVVGPPWARDSVLVAFVA